jgi:hypothetical protein
MRKRSKYKPKGVRLDNMTWVQAGLKRIDEVSESATIKIRNHDAINTLRLGTATKEEINVLINAMNVAEALADRGWGKDWKPEIRIGQDALLALGRRGVANGMRFVVKGEELKALNLCMEVHDAQLEAVTVRELELAMEDVMEALRLKKMRPVVETRHAGV